MMKGVRKVPLLVLVAILIMFTNEHAAVDHASAAVTSGHTR